MSTLLGKLPWVREACGGGDRSPGPCAEPVKPANERPWLVLVGIHRVPDRDSALPSLLLGIHGAPNLQRGLQGRCVSLWHPDRVWLMSPRRVPKSVRGGCLFWGVKEDGLQWVMWSSIQMCISGDHPPTVPRVYQPRGRGRWSS